MPDSIMKFHGDYGQTWNKRIEEADAVVFSCACCGVARILNTTAFYYQTVLGLCPICQETCPEVQHIVLALKEVQSIRIAAELGLAQEELSRFSVEI